MANRQDSSNPPPPNQPPSPFLQHSPLLHWCPEGEYKGKGGEQESKGEASGTVVAEPSCHHSRTSTFNRVLCTLPSYSRHCTALRRNPSKPLFWPLPAPLVGGVLSAGVFSFFFLKGRDESRALQSFQASKLICVWAATEAARGYLMRV